MTAEIGTIAHLRETLVRQGEAAQLAERTAHSKAEDHYASSDNRPRERSTE